MSIVAQVMVVGVMRPEPRRRLLMVHQPGIPVAILGLALRAPVRPDAELGIAEPVGRAIPFRERLPIRSELARRRSGGNCRRCGGGPGNKSASCCHFELRGM